MASENSKKLQTILASVMKPLGFKKEGATWRKRNANSISVINLQGSQWGPSFYMNLGIYFLTVGDNEKPPEYHCHLRTRLTELVPDRQRLDDVLDLEKPIALTIRFEELVAAVVNYGLPWLQRVSTVEGAREYCKSSSAPWVTADARELLGLSPGA